MLFICVRERSIRGLRSPVLEFCTLCRAEFGLNSATVPFLHTRQVNGCSENEDRRPKTRKRRPQKIATRKRRPPPLFFLFYFIRTPIRRRSNAAVYFLIVASIFRRSSAVLILSTIKERQRTVESP